jgi:predicted acyltransferase
LLGILLWTIDIKGYTRWTKPFQVFGINPLFLYVFSEILAVTLWIKVAHAPGGEQISITNWIYNTWYLPLAGAYNGSLLYALTVVFICWLAGWVLFKKKIFIKL